MAPDRARAETQPVLQAPAADLVLPVPRPPVLEAPEDGVSRRPSVPPAPGSAPGGIARPAPRTAREARAGWIVTSVLAAAASWTVGWVAGALWAWRQMTPKYLSRPFPQR
jgi:hypothetical protein